MYLEVSGIAVRSLASAEIPRGVFGRSSGSFTLRFFYNMYGSSVGSLTVTADGRQIVTYVGQRKSNVEPCVCVCVGGGGGHWRMGEYGVWGTG